MCGRDILYEAYVTDLLSSSSHPVLLLFIIPITSFCLYHIVMCLSFLGNPFEWIERLLMQPLTETERSMLTTKFSGYMLSITTRTMTVLQARKLLTCIRASLCTATVAKMVNEGFVFDGLLGFTGQGKAVIYYVIRVEGLEILCGKVYLKNDLSTDLAQFTEVMSSAALHSNGKKIIPNIVYYKEVLNISHINHKSESLALIMPLYKLSLQNVIESFGDLGVPWKELKRVASSMIQAGLRLEQCGLVHCDFKPDNMMLGDDIVVLIDLGSVVAIGVEIVEYTPFYGLDCLHVAATHQFDIFCLTVSLCRAFIPGFIVRARTALALMEELTACGATTPSLLLPVEFCKQLLRRDSFVEANLIPL